MSTTINQHTILNNAIKETKNNKLFTRKLVVWHTTRRAGTPSDKNDTLQDDND
jgi:hypothetical protein